MGAGPNCSQGRRGCWNQTSRFSLGSGQRAGLLAQKARIAHTIQPLTFCCQSILTVRRLLLSSTLLHDLQRKLGIITMPGEWLVYLI